MPNYPTRLISESDVYSYLNIDSDNISDNLESVVKRVMKAVENEIDNIVGQPILPRPVTVTFESAGKKMRLLRNFPIIELVSVKCTEMTDDGLIEMNCVIGTDVSIIKKDSVYFLLMPGGGKKGAIYTVELIVGYEVVPEAVRQVAVEMTAIKIKESDAQDKGGRLGLASVGTGSMEGLANITTSYKDEFPKFRRMLLPYKLPIY